MEQVAAVFRLRDHVAKRFDVALVFCVAAFQNFREPHGGIDRRDDAARYVDFTEIFRHHAPATVCWGGCLVAWVGSQGVNDRERQAAYRHLKTEIPFIVPLIEATGELALPKPRKISVAESLVHIVAGQMLSRIAAQTIINRLGEATQRLGLKQLYELDDRALRACGLSARKAKTIAAIRDLANEEGQRLEEWRLLEWVELRREVSSIWGLGDWSAGVLAIFDFAMPNVFPLGDGSLVRAMRAIEKQYMVEGTQFPHERGEPYGSYLAITLWAALDNGHLASALR